MKSRLLHSEAGQRTFAVIFDTGDEVVSALTAFARRERLQGSHLTAIGAFRNVVVAYFDWTSKSYIKTPIDEQVEVLSFIGDIALKDGQPSLHAHVVLGKADGTAHGGHLVEGWVRPTLEVAVTESPTHLRRVLDKETGLALIATD
jgi:predicted DNA-binding protein with PD1-like motif